jgi:hypothetical protein
MIKNPALISHKNCLLNHHFSLHLVHAHSEQHFTSDLSELYVTLLLINFTLLTADTYSGVYKNSVLTQKSKSPALLVPSFFHLTSYTSTKSNLYLANSLAAAAVTEPSLNRLPAFQLPNLTSRFRSLDRTAVSVQVRAFLVNGS